MSHIAKITKGLIRKVDSDGNDVVRPIPVYRKTIIPKNKYSKMYQDAETQLTEEKPYENIVR